MRDEGFDQFAAGSTEGLRAAKICSVCLDEGRIEVVLADEKAELIPQSRLTIARPFGSFRDFLEGIRGSGPEDPPNSSTEHSPIP